MRFVKEAFESNYIAPLGPQVDAFEREFAEYVGIKHCVAVSSGTAAMHLALTLRILGVGRAFVFLKQKMLLFSLMCYNIYYLVEVKKI